MITREQRDKAVELLKDLIIAWETPMNTLDCQIKVGQIKEKAKQFLKENNLMEPTNGA